ncbi:MAG: adenosine kinase [Paludibacteraceae bacterium]|nr:adenosine kinase [Paludibacteraceae bacterium]
MKILGIGNSLVDMLCRLPNENVIEKYNLPKGGMQLIDDNLALQISNDIKHLECQFVAGGSAANTTSGLANLGAETSFLGKIGNDEVGNYFEADLVKSGIEAQMIRSSLPTGRCISLISPDSERTMCTCLGATGTFSAEDIKPEYFKGADVCHIGGYLVQNHDLIEKVMQTAKEAGVKVSLDLASYNVVEENFDFMHHLAKNYVDIAFANEDEGHAFTKCEDLKRACEIMSEDIEVAIVKCGAKGVWTKRGDEIAFVEGLKGRNCIDTTGAGDLFASGYLYGLLSTNDITVAAKYGAIVGGNIVEHIGTKMPAEVWANIKTAFSKI